MAMKCLKNGFRVTEVPAHEYRRKGGVSKINVLRVSHIYIWNLLCGIIGPQSKKPKNWFSIEKIDPPVQRDPDA